MNLGGGLFRGLSGIASQGINAAGGFLITLFLAHALPLEAFGRFSLHYALLFLLQAPVMALVGEPMLVFANPRHGHRLGDYFLCALKLTAVLSLPAAVVLLILTILLPVPSLAGVAVALPAVCLYTVTRLVCFTCGKPWRALRGDVAFVAAALLGLLAVSSVGGLNVGTAFLVLAGANVAALLIATGADTVFWRSSDVSLRTLFAENWKFGRWLIGYQILKWGMGLGVIPLAAFLVGLGAAAGLRAVQTLFQPFAQLSVSLLLLLIPSASRRLADESAEGFRRFMASVFLGFSGSACLYAIILLLFAKPLMAALFPTEYQAYAALSPYLGAALVLQSVLAAVSIHCRIRERTALMLAAEVAGGVTVLLGGYVMAHIWGLDGLAGSLILTPTVSLTVMAVHLRIFPGSRLVTILGR
jgi:O-antigen/teichoic acid export membrane protein